MTRSQDPPNRCWIEWRTGYARTPYTPWAHINIDPEVPWTRSQCFDPPLPPPVEGRGHPMFIVEYQGFAFTFASLSELQHVASVLGRRRLLEPAKLVREHIEAHGRRGEYVNDHWLTRLPRWVRSHRYRFGAAAFLTDARDELARKLAAETGG